MITEYFFPVKKYFYKQTLEKLKDLEKPFKIVFV
jgi:hypothetical protein